MLAPFSTLARNLALGGVAAGLWAAAPAAAQSDREPLALFQDAICPGVVGLKLESAEQVVGRIRANAHALGLRLAPENDCRPNVVVGVLPDGAAFLERMKDDNGWLFAEMDREEGAALLADPGPARAFLRVRARSRDGMPIARAEDLTSPPETTMWMAHSKIYTATRNDILSSLILFDRAAVRGMSVVQLADYATFRALAHTLPQVVALRQDSILALFERGATPPTQLTEFDMAYLRAMYDGIPNIPAAVRIAHLEEMTGRDLFIE
jgi:hypothetical protein